MKRKLLRQLAKKINLGNEVNINFIFAAADHFCYKSETNTLEISTFFYRLPRNEIIISLVHEIGHMNTYQEGFFCTTYSEEYEANQWALYRLDELGWFEELGWYKIYLDEMAHLEVTDDDEEEYQTAARDLLMEMEDE